MIRLVVTPDRTVHSNQYDLAIDCVSVYLHYYWPEPETFRATNY